MGKLYQRYIIFIFVKNFFVIFIGLEVFYIGVDLMSNLKNLPVSANLQLLYVYYNGQIAMNYTIPLGLVFAMIVSKLSMIRSNELISFYTSGISRSQAILPIFLVSLFFTLSLIFLNFTSFANASNYRSNILKYNRVEYDSSKLFVKYNNQYVYFDSFSPLEKEAKNAMVLSTKGTDLKSIIKAPRAVFANNYWNFENAVKIVLPDGKKLGDKGLVKETKKTMALLHGFKPEIIDVMNAGKANLNAKDAYDAFMFLNSQHINTIEIKSSLYYLVFFPLFSPLMVIILFYFLPAIGRFFNLALLSFLLIFITLCVWGVMFAATKFSAHGVIMPEIGIILPIAFMMLFSIKLYYQNK